MIRLPSILFLAVWLALPAAAQDPLVEMEFDADAPVVLGQPVALRLTVLVPTFMPQPPVLPSFETPDLMVRLNGRATNPTSRRIDGETWSGITRSYSLYPMVQGQFNLPAQEVGIVFMDTTSTEQRVQVTTAPVSFIATLPEGAEGLDPPLIAASLTAKQEITAPEGSLTVGDAIQRRIEVTISGASPLFVPALLGPVEGAQLRAYPKDPTLSEAEDRGVLSGSRTEETTYVALAEGTAILPTLSLSWFNLGTGAVETLELEGASYEVAPGPAAPVEWDRAMLVKLALAGLGTALAIALFARFGWPALRAWRTARLETRRRSERVMYRRIEAAVAARNLADTLAARAVYEAAHGSGRPAPQLDLALSRVAETSFGATPITPQETAARWSALAAALEDIRPAANGEVTSAALPPLNPVWRA